MRFIVDAQLPPALAKQLLLLGHEAEHVNDVGYGIASDRQICARAGALGAVIITKDSDFVRLATLGECGQLVIWIRFGNITNAALWTRLGPRLPEIVDAILKGETLIEVT